jgi:ribonuclease BN (tRNA processing enzyme)
MARIEVIAIGVGDSFSERHVTASLLLESAGFRLAVDCPDRFRGALRAAGEKAGRPLSLFDVDHVLVTHVHGDHMNGLEGAAFFKRFAQGRRLAMITSPDVRDVVWEQRLRAPMETLWTGQRFETLGFDDYFAHTTLPWDRPLDLGPFTIRAYRTRHHVPTSALLIEAAGRRVGYSADTAFDPALIEFLSPADLIIHETNYGPAHTAYEDLRRLPAELKERMRLIHYPDELDLKASEIAALREGDVVAV